MKTSYDAEADALYTRFRDGRVDRSQEAVPGVALDFDENDRLVGVEVLNASVDGKSTTENKRALGSDLAKVGAHVIQPEEYEEIPEWTDEMFDRAEFRIGDKLIKPGSHTKKG